MCEPRAGEMSAPSADPASRPPMMMAVGGEKSRKKKAP